MAKMDTTSQITALALPLLDSLGLELVELEYRKEGHGMVLRLYIDKPQGVTLDDCADVSRELSEILDVEDVISGHYNLEVSSPGLNRPLKKESDYARYTGRLVKIRTFEMVADDAGNKRKTFLGELLGLADGTVSIKLTEGQSAAIPFDKIAKANLEFEM
ncbi:MAG TPA: ribosome maturation factor RimP [Geobacteraceae bacterium]|nr:ribosome maturation factor RimP [Geobacteraceae bacterium]